MTNAVAGGPNMRVAVIGAGIIGAAIAYRLARRGCTVTIVDRHQPAAGATRRSFAWINAGAKTPASYHDLNRRSLEMWNRFAGELATEVGLRWGGKISWANTETEARTLVERVQRLQSWGYPCRVIDEAELRRLEPNLNPGKVIAAEYSEIEGQVEPQLVVAACLQWASQAGAVTRYETAVTGFSLAPTGSRIQTVHTTGGDLPCDLVVLAAGVDTTELASKLEIEIPQEESPGVVVRTDPQPPLLRSVPVLYPPPVDAQHDEIHLRQTHDGAVLIGEGSQESLHRDDSQEHADDLLSRASRYLPALDSARATPVPMGFRPMPIDGYPVIGFTPAVPNLYVALTHSGVTLCPLVSELAALEIFEGTRVEFLRDYRPQRFTKSVA